MIISIGLDNIINAPSIFYRIWGIIHDHVRCFTRSMDMDIPIVKNGLQYSFCMSIYFLDAVETTFCHTAWEGWELFDTDDAWVSDDEEIELIIDPVEEDKCEESDPIYSNSSPVDWFVSENIENRSFIAQEHPGRDHEGDEIEKMIHEDNPMTV